MIRTALDPRGFIDWVFANRQSWVAGALNLKGAQPLTVIDRAVECYAGTVDETLFDAALAIREFQAWQQTYQLFFCGQSEVFERTHRTIIASFENAEILTEYVTLYPVQAKHRATLAHWLARRNPGQILFLGRADTVVS